MIRFGIRFTAFVAAFLVLISLPVIAQPTKGVEVAQEITVTSEAKIAELRMLLTSLTSEDTDKIAITRLRLVYALEEAGQHKGAIEEAIGLEEYVFDETVLERIKAYSLYRLVLAHAKKDDFSKVFGILNRYSENSPADSKILRAYATNRALAELYEFLEYHERSAAIIEETMMGRRFEGLNELNDDAAANYLLLAKQYLEIGEAKKAALILPKADDEIRSMLEREPNADPYVLGIISYEIARTKMRALLQMGDIEEARIGLSSLLDTADKFGRRDDAIELLLIQADIHIATNENAAAIEKLGEILASPEFDSEGKLALKVNRANAIAFEATNNLQESIKSWEELDRLRRKFENKRIGSRLAYLTAEVANSARTEKLNELELKTAIADGQARRSKKLAILGGVAALASLIALLVAIWSMRNQAKSRIALTRHAEQLKLSEARARDNEKKANAASEAKSAFLANMSHEIRTPMNGVLGMAQVLRSSGLNNQQQEYANIIHSSGTALLTIINDVLDFSKIEAGKLELDPTPSNLREAVEDVSSILSMQAEEKQLELAIRYAPGAPERIVADIGRVRQVLMNLIGNAIKFTHEGHVLINITGQERQGIASLQIEVRDTGIGIPDDRIAEIFEDFSQAESSTTREFGGTGLGLAITKSLVNAMGGEISVSSRYGAGSAFKVKIDFPIDETARPKSILPVFNNRKRILLIDDLEINRKILSELMSSWGVDLMSAKSGAAGYKMMLQAEKSGDPFDLVLLDYQMPELNGRQVAEAIRKTQSICHTRLIVLTSADTGACVKLFASLNVDAFVTKPISAWRLCEAITNTNLKDKTERSLLSA